MQSLENSHSSLSQSHPELPLLHQLATVHFKHNSLSDEEEDLNEFIHVRIEITTLLFCPPHTRRDSDTP